MISSSSGYRSADVDNVDYRNATITIITIVMVSVRHGHGSSGSHDPRPGSGRDPQEPAGRESRHSGPVTAAVKNA